MKQILYALMLLVLSAGCSRQSPKEKIANLNGYWEIRKAELPEGITKEFRFSQLVDYIQVNDSLGFRKKVRPQLGGTFLTSEDREDFTVRILNDSIFLNYTTPYNSWKEAVIVSEEDQLKILNEHGIIYTYQRFTPYSDYEQENQ